MEIIQMKQKGNGSSYDNIYPVGSGGSILRLNYDSTFSGKSFTISANGVNVFTGVFNTFGQEENTQFFPLIKTNTEYTITSDGRVKTVTTEEYDKVIEFKLRHWSATIVATYPVGSNITCSKGGVTLTGDTSGHYEFTVTSTGTWTLSISDGSQTASDSVTITESDDGNEIPVSLGYVRIYGAEWAGGSSTVWTRTDDSKNFSNPNPKVGGSGGSSPFDSLMPWSGMVRETDSAGGELVKIPKFYFKWTKTGTKLKLQIADGPVSGFSVSPAHMNRGDGKGERDYVYVGRYHCASGYKSTSGVRPLVNITRSAARSGIHNLGANYWQMDYATRLTIQMLYLVEFADWDSQKCIGKGCGNNSSTENMGYTNNMRYHTGTTQSSRDTYGLGTQYRWIEGLWDNVYDWMDGCYYSSSGMSVILNPSNFSDTSNGTVIGTPSSGYPTVMSLSTTSGYEWCMYPTTANGSKTTYVPDFWSFGAGNPCLPVGGSYIQDGDRGLFFVSSNGVSDSSGNIGARLLKLP